jgi:hypothetical protein
MAPQKPSEKEDEYFFKMEQERIEKLRAGLDKKREEQARLTCEEEHWMKCPKCCADLKEVNYQNVMIDVCSECKGVWLDHGELDLLAKGKAQFTEGLLKRIFK